MTGRRSQPLTLRAIFAIPAAIFLFGIIGLIGALTGDGWRDALSWLALAVPLAVCVWAMRTRRS